MANITRRDLLHGALTAPPLLGLSAGVQARAGSYPPELTGMRGSHQGSFEVAHRLSQAHDADFGSVIAKDEDYDLVVVGAGVSGLAAAYFYRQENPQARILIIDNHDDFGGHAKRNEFLVDGKRLIGYGGSQTMEAPSSYSDVVKTLLTELAVDLDAFDEAYDQDFFRRHNLRGGTFFDQETYGRSAFVGAPLADVDGFLKLAQGAEDVPAAILQMPIGAADRAELLQLLTASGDALENVGLTELPDFLGSISYLDFLKDHLGVQSPVVINLLHGLPSSYFGVGIDAVTALEALAFGLPGGRQLGVPGFTWLRKMLTGMVEPYIHHFPDGNASIARLLVRSLIPDLVPEVDPERLLHARFDYARLDQAANQTRIRLNATAVGAAKSKDGVTTSYVTQGQAFKVRSKHCVLACYNMMIPYLVPDLPAPQKAALAEQVKVPLVYTNVVLKRWHALKDLGIGQVFSPNMFHQLLMVDFPVSLGDYQYAQTPDDPLILHMSSAFGAPGLPPKTQFRVGRAKLLRMSYADIEKDLINHLQQLLGPGGFDSGKDIAAITVNRWPHGYAYGSYSLFDPEYPPGSAPHEVGRKTFGPIAIANSDAGARAYLDAAIDQAHRAVHELL